MSGKLIIGHGCSVSLHIQYMHTRTWDVPCQTCIGVTLEVRSQVKNTHDWYFTLMAEFDIRDLAMMCVVMFGWLVGKLIDCWGVWYGIVVNYITGWCQSLYSIRRSCSSHSYCSWMWYHVALIFGLCDVLLNIAVLSV